jgi:Txe/YoeB family toxin of Txe-Axe toxin-antitoxin module
VCETWSRTLREQHKLMYENEVLRNIFGPEREYVARREKLA